MKKQILCTLLCTIIFVSGMLLGAHFQREQVRVQRVNQLKSELRTEGISDAHFIQTTYELMQICK